MCRQRISSPVYREDDGVAGFFEDIPVLLFVLMGVTTLVVSAAWVSRENAARVLEGELDDAARDIVRSLLGKVLLDFGPAPRLSSLADLDILPIMRDRVGGHSCSVSVATLHPGRAMVASETIGDLQATTCTGFACAPFKALDDRGFTLILEVRAIVW